MQNCTDFFFCCLATPKIGSKSDSHFLATDDRRVRADCDLVTVAGTVADFLDSKRLNDVRIRSVSDIS